MRRHDNRVQRISLELAAHDAPAGSWRPMLPQPFIQVPWALLEMPIICVRDARCIAFTNAHQLSGMDCGAAGSLRVNATVGADDPDGVPAYFLP